MGLANSVFRRRSVCADRTVSAGFTDRDVVCDHACRGTERDINLLWDIFVSDRNTGRIVRASVDSAGEWMESSTAPSIDARGRVVAFVTRHRAEDSNGEAVYVVRPLR